MELNNGTHEIETYDVTAFGDKTRRRTVARRGFLRGAGTLGAGVAAAAIIPDVVSSTGSGMAMQRLPAAPPSELFVPIPNVQAGDMLSAPMMNNLIDQINRLGAQLNQLAAGGTA